MSSSFSTYLSKFSQVFKYSRSLQLPLGRHPVTWILVPMVVASVLPPLRGLQPDAKSVTRDRPSPDLVPSKLAAKPQSRPAPQQHQPRPAARQTTAKAKPQPAAPQQHQPVQPTLAPSSVPIAGTLPTGTSKVMLRVAIAEGENTLALGASTPAQLVDAQGRVLETVNPNEGIQVQAKAGMLHIGTLAAPALVWLVPTQNGAIYVGDRWYRGALQLSLQGDNLLAVNYVDLEEYLYSVVSSEVSPSWPLAAQKAQAIAARSFALVHYFRPASDLYDLGSTERYQVYGGLSNEWNTSQQAVEETRGLVLSYGGGVVESQYAASEDLVKEVFGGRGMSQQGAYQLSTRGYSFQQILGYFYPGTSLARLQAS